ncbi:MAG TPA: ADOP family duplicated permease [Gemmatimonadaceae bacterium]|nr:ADOP family duplicated permease [Gemmatimonadaceae bacterium]
MPVQIDSFLRDARQAARSLRRTPTVAAVAILCFAIGIGVNATMFGVVNALLFRAPPHVQGATHVFQLRLTFLVPGGGAGPMLGGGHLTNFDFAALRSSAHTMDAAAFSTHDLTLDRGAAAHAATVTFATPSFFRLLGVRPALGRFFAEDEDNVTGGSPVAVLSFGLWQRRFGGDSAVLGRTLPVARGTYTIVGVAPEHFRGTDLQPVDLWLPTGAALHELYRDSPQQFRIASWLDPLVRPRAGISTADAAADASRAFQLAYSQRFGPRFHAITVAKLEPIIPGLGGTLSKDARVSLWVAGVSVIVLLVAIVNVANMLLARVVARRREIAVRVALGVSRSRLARQLLLESLLLAGAGTLIALVMAVWGSALVGRFFTPDLSAVGALIDARVLLLAAAAAVATAVLCALLPMRQAVRTDVSSGLKAGARDGAAGRSALRTGMLVAQVALTMVLLVGAGLFARSLRALRSIDLGMDAGHLVVARMSLADAGYDASASARIMERLRRRVQALPGVRAASLAYTAPFLGSFSWPDFIVPNSVKNEQASGGGGPHHPLLDINDVSPGFFAALGTPLVRGRAFTRADEQSGIPVAIINQTMAHDLWPSGNAIGQCIQVGGVHTRAAKAPCSEIIGIARDTHARTLREAPRWAYFAPTAAHDVDGTHLLLVRTAGDPRTLLPAIRHSMQATAANLPYADVRTMSNIIAPQTRPWLLGTTMFTLFGVIALVLALCGLYGVFSYAVEQRQRELGVRVAFGARSADITRLIVGEGVRAGAIGVALGLVGAMAVGRALESLLVGVSWLDVSVLVAMSGLMLATTVVATYLPARRAARVDPTTLLRIE